jgi:hypothetical protein
MRPIFQTEISKGFGNCHQAVIASLFELPLDHVPNFRLFPSNKWAEAYFYFVQTQGYEFFGTNNLTQTILLLPKEKDSFLDVQYSVNGYFDAVVPSRTHLDVNHAVIVDEKGIVVHDPNPNGLWLGEQTLIKGGLKYYLMLKKKPGLYQDEDKGSLCV